jgi:hypothetical protein
MFLYLYLFAALAASSELPETQQLLTANETTIISESDIVTDNTIVEQQQPQSITITNGIKPDMLAYKHWTGTYTPDEFTVTINGVSIAQGAQHTLPADTTNIDLQYHYSFMNGMRSGTKTVSYQLHENVSTACITFSWKDDWKLLLDNATAIKEISS